MHVQKFLAYNEVGWTFRYSRLNRRQTEPTPARRFRVLAVFPRRLRPGERRFAMSRLFRAYLEKSFAAVCVSSGIKSIQSRRKSADKIAELCSLIAGYDLTTRHFTRADKKLEGRSRAVSYCSSSFQSFRWLRYHCLTRSKILRSARIRHSASRDRLGLIGVN